MIIMFLGENPIHIEVENKNDIAIERLFAENNHLKIIFHSAVQKGKDEAKKLSYTLPENERIFVRKAQYQFGWDWGPRFVTAGIWQKVQLKFWNSAKIETVRYDQKVLDEKQALLDIIITIDVQKAAKYQIYF